MKSRNALVFSLCPPLLVMMAISICMVQFNPATNPNVLPIQFNDGGKIFTQMIGFIFVYSIAFNWAAKPSTIWEWICTLSAAIILPASMLMLPYSLSQTVVQSPTTFDLNVIPLDGAIGFQPSIEMARIFVRFPHFADACRFFYDQILLVIAIVSVGEAYNGRRLGVGAIATFLLMSSIGFLIYFALPVVGPAPFFGDAFPLITGQTSATAPRNCMPSLHTAYALVAFLSTRQMNMLFRAFVGVMSLFVAAATLGLGEHYLVDLVLACPLVAMFRAASTLKLSLMSFERITAFIVPGLLLIVWASLVRGSIAAPALSGIVVVAMAMTVSLSLFLESRLATAERVDSFEPRHDECTLELPMASNAESAV